LAYNVSIVFYSFIFDVTVSGGLKIVKTEHRVTDIGSTAKAFSFNVPSVCESMSYN